MARKVEARPARKPKAKAKTAPVKPRAGKTADKARTVAGKVRPPRKPRLPKARTSPEEDALAVEAFNRRYYDAFQSLSVDEVAKVWWHDEDASCVHPGWDIRHGWQNVLLTYQEIFASTRSIRFALGDVRVRLVGELAYVTCVENLVSEEADSADYLGAVLATNLYERRRGEWKMIHHHASPFSSDDADIPEGPLH